jgi:putative oxidoreductase
MPRGAALESYGATVLRLFLGVIYLMHAYFALQVTGPAAMARHFAQQNLPFPMLWAWYLILAHGLGGLCLILGLLVRAAAIANIPIMLGAVLVVHLKQGFFMKPEGGYEFALLVLGATIAQAFLGPGAFTLKK